MNSVWVLLTESEKNKCLREAEYLVSNGFISDPVTVVAEKLAENLVASKQVS